MTLMVDVKDGKLGNYLGNSSTTYTKSLRQMPGARSTRDMEARIARIYLKKGK